MASRSVQILYHLFGVARNTEQGVVGPVLTECHMDDEHTANLAEARLRETAREGQEMLAAEADLRSSGSDPLIEAALDHLRESCCRRALTLLESLHDRWVRLLRSLTPEQWKRTFRHPDLGPMNLEKTLALYAWHGRHHVAHITELRKRMSW